MQRGLAARCDRLPQHHFLARRPGSAGHRKGPRPKPGWAPSSCFLGRSGGGTPRSSPGSSSRRCRPLPVGGLAGADTWGPSPPAAGRRAAGLPGPQARPAEQPPGGRPRGPQAPPPGPLTARGPPGHRSATRCPHGRRTLRLLVGNGHCPGSAAHQFCGPLSRSRTESMGWGGGHRQQLGTRPGSSSPLLPEAPPAHSHPHIHTHPHPHTHTRRCRGDTTCGLTADLDPPCGRGRPPPKESISSVGPGPAPGGPHTPDLLQPPRSRVTATQSPWGSNHRAGDTGLEEGRVRVAEMTRSRTVTSGLSTVTAAAWEEAAPPGKTLSCKL